MDNKLPRKEAVRAIASWLMLAIGIYLLIAFVSFC